MLCVFYYCKLETSEVDFVLTFKYITGFTVVFLLNNINSNNLPNQELLTHSTDRPERQQLKEALEAMQVCATHVFVMCVFMSALSKTLHNNSKVLQAKAV